MMINDYRAINYHLYGSLVRDLKLCLVFEYLCGCRISDGIGVSGNIDFSPLKLGIICPSGLRFAFSNVESLTVGALFFHFFVREHGVT